MWAKFSFPELNRNTEWELSLLTFSSPVLTLVLCSKQHSSSLRACLGILCLCRSPPTEKFWCHQPINSSCYEALKDWGCRAGRSSQVEKSKLASPVKKHKQTKNNKQPNKNTPTTNQTKRLLSNSLLCLAWHQARQQAHTTAPSNTGTAWNQSVFSNTHWAWLCNRGKKKKRCPGVKV